MPPNIRPLANGALLTVIVGSTFHGDLTPVVIPTTPTRQPPNVRRDPGATRSTLFRVRKRLPFTVEYPTLLESASNLDNGYGETPVRIYPLGGTADAAADVPQGGGSSTGGSRRRTGPTRRCSTTRASRSGSAAASSTSTTRAAHLHMVVLRDNGATYWVVNTLLDSLSNETMLAIARGLRPLPR